MKIALLTNLYPPYVRGGAEYLMHELVRELTRQGHRVVVVTSVPRRSLKRLTPEQRVEDGVTIYRFYPLNLYHYLTAERVPYPLRLVWQIINLFNWPAARTVMRILQREQPELVVSSNLMGLSFLLPRAVAKLGFKHVHVLHDVQLLHPSGLFRWDKGRGGLVAALYRSLTRRLFAPVGAVVSPSRWLLAEHTAHGFFRHSRQEVLRNPVLPTDVAPGLKTTKPPLQLLYVGQLEEHKGVLWLLATLDKLPRQDFALHIYALGQKPNVQQVKDLVSHDSRFVLHDLPSQREIDEAYGAAHLVLVPSLCYENSPIAIPRAFAAGTPVLATNLGGIPELVRVGETGWLHAPGDSRDLISKLNWCLDNPGSLLQAGLAASREFEDRTLERYAKELLALAQPH